MDADTLKQRREGGAAGYVCQRTYGSQDVVYDCERT